nr:hypothetical protein [Tissierella sp.]
MNKKDWIRILITYILATLIRALAGVNYNLFHDKFDLILFLKDFSIWTVSYILVSLVMSSVSKGKDKKAVEN